MRDRSTLPDWPVGMRRETAAAYLDVSPATFNAIVASGRLPPPTALTRGCKVWRRRDLDALLDPNHGQPNDPAARPVEDLAGEWDLACDGARAAALS